MNRPSFRAVIAFALVLIASAAARAQDDDDRVLNLAEPDFTIISLPTSLRLPEHKGAFRVAHRFTRPLNCDVCADNLLEDFFGLDNGARIALEYRFGIVPNGELGVHRSSDKTIEFFGQYGLTRQSGRSPLETSVLVAVDGTNNFRDEYSPVLGLILTRLVGDRAALYAEPMWVNNTNFGDPASASDNTFVVGLGARIRLGASTYLVGEAAPRVSGYSPGVTHGGFGIEKRVGGHVFQLNFTNSFDTTLGQIARGAVQGTDASGALKTDWYLGFNISRKFF